jgi:hypothetical protein
MDLAQQIENSKSVLAGSGELYAVHYASESFSEAQNAPMAVSAIAIFDLRSDSVRAFSRLDVSGDQATQELTLLQGFYAFLSAHRDASFLHWNMGGIEFGFEAIAKRYQFLTSQEPSIVAPREQYNVDKMIRARYGEDYAPHRRFESIGRLNGLDLRGFLSGLDEAEAYERKKWGDIARSTSTKAKLIASLFRRLSDGALRTNNSAGRFDFAGGQLDAASAVISIGERFVSVQRALRKRHGGRLAVEFDDEYDDQYLMKALLALFFEDVRPEDYVPSYAGGNSRVDFLLPQHGLAIELKHTRKGLKDKELGEQLVIDRDRYVGASKANHLIALVFDPNGEIDNPRGLEIDLQRRVGTSELAVTVRIYS